MIGNNTSLDIVCSWVGKGFPVNIITDELASKNDIVIAAACTHT